ncbi:MAG TPA: hypothetical protein VF164_04505, partial [Trueperaceae bacterium]
MRARPLVFACLVSLAWGSALADDPRQELRDAQLAALPVAISELALADISPQGFVQPISGRLSSGFGWRNVSVNGNRYHAGVDWAAPAG